MLTHDVDIVGFFFKNQLTIQHFMMFNGML